MCCKKKILLLLVCLVTCLFSMTYLSTYVAKATNDYEFTMTGGAQIRVDFSNSSKEGVENLIRFTSTIEKSAIDDNEGAKLVTIITLTDYLKEANLNDQDGFTLANLDEKGVKYQTVEFSKKIGNLIEDGDNYVIRACLYNIKEANIAEEMSAISYLDLGNGPVQYTEYVYNGQGATGDHASSIWEIANEVKDDADFNDENNVCEELSSEYTLTVQSFEDSSVTEEVTIRRGESLADVKDKVNEVVSVDGVAYFNGTATKDGQEFAPEYISADQTITINYNALAFEVISSENAEETAECGGKYKVSVGTLTPEDTLVIKVPETFNGVEVVRLGSLGAKAFTHVILPESVTQIYGSFNNMSSLEYVYMPGVSLLNEYYYTDKTTASRAGWNAFLNCYKLEYLILGNSLSTTGPHFGSQSTDENNLGNMSVYMLNDGDTFTKGDNAGLYSGNIYYYSENAEICGTWCFDDDGITVIKNEDEHLYDDDGKCFNCGIYDAKGVTYTFDTDHYIVSGYTGSDTKIVIPATFNDGNGEYPVTAVAANAFEYSTVKTTVEEIRLPSSVTTLGSRAFAGCTALKTIVMTGVSQIAASQQVFNFCANLTNIIVGTEFDVGQYNFRTTADLVTVIKILVDGASCSLSINSNENQLIYDNYTVYYYNEDGVTTGTWKYVDDEIIIVEKPESPEAYDDLGVVYTFDTDHYIVSGADAGLTEVIVLAEYCDGINGVHPVTEIAASAFENSSSKTTITKVILPDSVVTIGSRAFAGCTALAYVEMPGVTALTYQNFVWTNALETIVIGTELSVADHVFTRAIDKELNVLVYGTSVNLSINAGTHAENTGNYNPIKTASIYYYNEAGGENTWKYVDGIATINE